MHCQTSCHHNLRGVTQYSLLLHAVKAALPPEDGYAEGDARTACRMLTPSDW